MDPSPAAVGPRLWLGGHTTSDTRCPFQPAVRPSSLPQSLQPPGRREQDPGPVRTDQGAGHARPGADRSWQPLRRRRVSPRGQGGGNPADRRDWRPTLRPGKRTERSGGGVSGQEHAFHLTLLAKNATGFRNLMRLSSLSFLEGFYYKPRIDKEILERHAEGLICLSGCARPSFPTTSFTARRPRPSGFVRGTKRSSAKTTSTSKSRTTACGSRRNAPHGAIDIARRMGLPVVATSDAHYLTREDAPRTTSCSASTPARRSTTRRG